MSSVIQSKKAIVKSKSPDEIFKLWILFNTTFFACSRAREIEIAKYGITHEQAILIYTLIRNGGSATISEIAESTVRQYHSVSSLVKRMAKSGLVKKVKYSDKKKLEVSITDKGLEIYNKIPRNSVEMTFSVLTPRDKKAFTKCLQRLALRARDLLNLDYKHPFLP